MSSANSFVSQDYHCLKAAIIEEFMIFVPHLAFCWLQISDLWVTWCNHIETWKGQHYPVYTSIVLFLMQQQKSQSAIKERKLGQIAHCSAHCGRPNYHQNYTRVLELGSASPRDAHFLVTVKTSPVHVVLVSLLVDQLSGLFLIFFGRPKKNCPVSGNFWSVSGNFW